MTDMRTENRFDRMERTDWIDMRKIQSAKVFVAGAGALGNEVLKNLVLAGFRDITVADPDVVEVSNLSRCVLFRNRDVGRNKAEIAAGSAMDIYPEAVVKPIKDRIQSVNLEGYDIYLGCLDSISARLHLNSHAMFYQRPYVDGSTDGFRGKIQVILPGGPCMECSMNRTHLNELHRVFSCDPAKSVKLPEPMILSSGITTTSVIAAVCVREVIKIVCGKSDCCLDGVCYYDGMKGTFETVGLEVNPSCPNHGDGLCQLN